MNDLDAIMVVVDDVSNVKWLNDEILVHTYDLCMELIDIFGNEMTDRGIMTSTFV